MFAAAMSRHCRSLLFSRNEFPQRNPAIPQGIPAINPAVIRLRERNRLRAARHKRKAPEV